MAGKKLFPAKCTGAFCLSFSLIIPVTSFAAGIDLTPCKKMFYRLQQVSLLVTY